MSAETLGDVRAGRRRQWFVGRDAEFDLVRAALDEESPFSVLWFTGPGGIGKSSLLEIVGDLAEEAAGLKVARLDGRDVAPSPRAVLDAGCDYQEGSIASSVD